MQSDVYLREWRMGTMAKTGDEKAATMAKIARLMDAHHEQMTKLQAIADEITVLIAGGNGIGAQMKEAAAAFDHGWSLRYAGGREGSYAWHGAKDMPHLKRLVKLLGLEELTARMANYLKSDDPFYVRNRHTFGLFVSSVNSWTGAPAPVDEDGAPAVADCKHVPRCRTDVEHTSRKRLDLRA